MNAEQQILPEQLEALADFCIKKGLGTPALFFLEMYKPVTGVLAAVGDGFYPLLNLLFDSRKTNLAMQLLHDRQALEQFLTVLELKLQPQQPAGRPHGS